MQKKTLNANQLLTIEECRVVRRHLQADIGYGGDGSFSKFDPKTGQHIFDEKSARIAEKAMEKILAFLTYVPPRSTKP